MPLEQPGTTFTLGQGADIAGGMARGFELGDAFRQQRDKAQLRGIMQSSDMSTPEGQTAAAQKVSAINPQLGMQMLSQVRANQEFAETQQYHRQLLQDRQDEERRRQQADAEKKRKDAAVVTNQRLTNISENTARMYDDYEDIRDEQIKKGSNPKDADIFARQKVGADWNVWLGGLGTRTDEQGNPIFSPQQIAGIPKQFDPAQAKNLAGYADAGIKQMAAHEEQRRKAAADAAKVEAKAPTTRNVIYGDKEVTEEFDSKTGKWQQIGTPGPRFASGEADGPAGKYGTVMRDSETGQTYVQDAKSGKTWRLEDDGKYTAIPASEVPKNLAKPGVSGSQAGREAVFNQRIVTAGNQVSKALNNIVQLPLTSSSGILGGRQQGPGFMDAGKATLANTLTTQEVQSYNTMSAGIQRSLAAIEASGLAPGGTLSHQMDSVIFRAGDTN
ncbi:MAG: hypothetical protein HRJ53_25775, partial [Acidobacteria bacterium Pan2503]|nr:hypothetical protein [Candidatus Acidoferrum panamensis]